MKLEEVPLCVLVSRFGGWVKLLLLHLSAYQSLMPEPFGPLFMRWIKLRFGTKLEEATC